MEEDKAAVFIVSFSDAVTALSYFFIPVAMFAVVILRQVRH
jgi:hypothetical protein